MRKIGKVILSRKSLLNHMNNIITQIYTHNHNINKPPKITNENHCKRNNKMNLDYFWGKKKNLKLKNYLALCHQPIFIKRLKPWNNLKNKKTNWKKIGRQWNNIKDFREIKEGYEGI
jgi:hypothetical protein